MGTKPFPEGFLAMMKKAEEERDSAWHLDKRIPLAMIFAIAAQTSGIIWWGATTSERLNALERKVDFAAPQGDRLTRVEVNIEAIKDSLTEIKAVIRKPR